jgi:hypothetical protein
MKEDLFLLAQRANVKSFLRLVAQRVTISGKNLIDVTGYVKGCCYKNERKSHVNLTHK